MKKLKFGILVIIGILALVSAAAAVNGDQITVNIDHNTNMGGYWTIHVLNQAPLETAPQLLPIGDYTGFCSDYWGRVSDDKTFTPNIYSSLVGAFPVNSPAASINWYKINYILNQNVNYKVKQAAIWHYDGDSAAAYPEYSEISGYSHTDYDNLIADTELYGESYRVGYGGKFAVVLWDEKYHYQEIFAVTLRDRNTSAPEFPSIALPVGLIIGMIGLVYTIKTREK
jgi:hypothetical protein